MRRQIQARKCLNLHDLRNLVPQVVILKKCTDALFQRFLNAHTSQFRARCILLTVCTATLCLYWVIVNENILGSFVHGYFPGDITHYVIRLGSISLLLALVPLLTSRILGYRLGSMGLALPKKGGWLLLGGCVIMILSGFIASRNPMMQDFYPYSKTIAEYARTNGAWLALHIVLYSVFYYLPWEIFFRGVLVFPFVNSQSKMGIGHLAQMVPSTMLHFSHPHTELFSAILFGIITGYIVWKSQSILPGLVLHIIAGVSLDIFIIYFS